MPDSPFKLLEAYGPDEKDIFFGRDAEIFALYNLLQQTRLVLVYGASGTGKTSLIQAGLPKVFKVTNWFRVSVRRRDDINASLREELARSLPEGSATDDLPQSIQQVYERRWIPVYLVFDQFEELFTLGNHDERVRFFRDIQTLLDANLPCKIILSMREEYIGHLYDYEPLVPTLFDKRFRVEPMKDATVTEVVEKICAVNAIQLEKEAPQPAGEKTTAEQIKDQVKEGKQAAYLPYLQIYLHYLYEHALATKRRLVFDHSGITAVGELGDVLKKFIESKTTDAQQHLLTLGAPGDFAQRLLDEFATGDGTKQARRKTELSETLKVDEALVEKALLYFSDTAKLLRADEDDVERYEPVHDVVAKQIHELRSVEDKEYKAFLRYLETTHERWVRDNHATDRLLPEIDLNRVEIYRERLAQKDEFREKWAGLVEKSRSHIQAVRRRKRVANFVLAGITVVALVVGWWAMRQRDEARKQTKIAEEKTVLADSSAQVALKKTKETEDALIMAKVKELETQAALEQVKKEKAATEQQRRLSEERLVQFEQEKAQREAAEFVKLVADAKTFINSGDNQLALKKLRRANKLLPNDPEVVRLIKQCETKN